MHTIKRNKHVLLPAFLALVILPLIGCAMITSFVFLPQKEVYATPAQRNLPYKEIWFQARDGVTLNAWFLNGDPGLPVLLFFHGNGGNLSDNLDYLALLNKRGFSVFIFDYRGYGKSGGQPLQEEDLYNDARGALSYLEGLGWQRERIIYFGQSMGSSVALQLALEAPPAGLVMESSFTRMSDIIRYTSPFGYYSIGWWGINLAFDNVAKIGKLEVPLLLIHGDRDHVVPVEMTQRLFELAHEPKRLFIIKGGGHCDALRLDRSAYLSVWNSYLETLPVRVAGKGVTP